MCQTEGSVLHTHYLIKFSKQPYEIDSILPTLKKRKLRLARLNYLAMVTVLVTRPVSSQSSCSCSLCHYVPREPLPKEDQGKSYSLPI